MTTHTIDVTISSMLKELLTSCIDLAFPQNCHVCSAILSHQSGRFDKNICASCFDLMKKTPVAPYAANRLLCCYEYEAQVRELLHKFKYNNRPYLAKTIASLMIKRIEENSTIFNDIDMLVPVPLHPARQREREFNQALEIANALNGYFKKPMHTVLKKIKNTASQATLEPKQRLANMQGAFTVADEKAIKNKNILLIDDVVTTGSTVNEASKTLINSGCKEVHVLAFAKG